MKLVGVYTGSWNFGELTAEQIAATFDMSQSWVVDAPHDYSAKAIQVHALNPNYKFLVYRNVGDIYHYWTEEFDLALSSGWLLKDIDGNYLTSYAGENYRVDITNPAYQLWVAQKIKSVLDQNPYFDGVMADNGLICDAHQWQGDVAINPRTGTHFTDQETLDGNAGLLNAIIDAIGMGKLVLPNGIWNGAIWANIWPGGDNYRYLLSKIPRLSAIGSEGIFYQSYSQWWYAENLWQASIDMIAWFQDNFLMGHPERRVNGWVPIDGMPTDATPEQLMTFGFCSMMLGVTYSEQNTIGFGGISDFPNLMSLAQILRGVDLGSPLGNYYKTGSVYTRDFTNGKVLVNPTDTPYTVTLDKSYTDINYVALPASLIVAPHTGVILRSTIPAFTVPYTTGSVTLTLAPAPPQVNLTDIKTWNKSTYEGDPTLPNICFWQNEVLTPDGNDCWRIDPHTAADANPYREMFSPAIPIVRDLKVGDRIVYKIWARSGPATKTIDYPVPSTMGLLWDYRSNLQSFQVREHNSNAKTADGKYLCDIDPTWSLSKINQYEPKKFLPVNSIALHPETNGWMQFTLTGVIPVWSEELNAYEILNYEGTAWSTVKPDFISAIFVGAWYAKDQGCVVWIGDAEVYIYPTVNLSLTKTA